MINGSLVLEGGGMKGVYTAGVLDFFQDKDILFSSVYGVSAGACQMCSYLSKQRGRGIRTMTEYLNDKRYMGIESYLKTGDIFGADFNYNLVPNELDPFDYDEFDRYEGKPYAVVTNMITGEAEYILLENIRKDFIYVRASSSLPLVSRSLFIKNIPYLDGGIADSIPLEKSMHDGNAKNVVVLTKPVGYRKSQEHMLGLMKLRYKKYPKIYELMKNRHERYNANIEFVEKEAEKGNIFLIRPLENMEIGRLERDKDKLMALYQEGYDEAKASYDAMMSYLNA